MVAPKFVSLQLTTFLLIFCL